MIEREQVLHVARLARLRLTDDEVERMGVALMELESKMAEMRDAFGLGPEDLSIDLGPLGRLL